MRLDSKEVNLAGEDTIVQLHDSMCGYISEFRNRTPERSSWSAQVHTRPTKWETGQWITILCNCLVAVHTRHPRRVIARTETGSKKTLLQPPHQGLASGPAQVVSEKYDMLLVGMQEAFQAAMQPDKSFKIVCKIAIQYLQDNQAENLVEKLPKNLGFCIGLALLTLSPPPFLPSSSFSGFHDLQLLHRSDNSGSSATRSNKE